VTSKDPIDFHGVPVDTADLGYLIDCGLRISSRRDRRAAGAGIAVGPSRCALGQPDFVPLGLGPPSG